MLRSILFSLCLSLSFLTQASPVLEDVLKSAEELDPTLASAMANRDAAFNNIAINRAKLLPQISYQSSYQKLTEGVSSGGSFFSPPSSTLYNVFAKNNAFTLQQPLYNARAWDGFKLGQYQSLYGEHKFQSARIDLWKNVCDAWIQVAATFDQLRILQKGTSLLYKNTIQEKQLFNAGYSTKDKVLEAESQYALHNARIKETEISLESKINNLNLITGKNFKSSDFVLTLPDFNNIHINVTDLDSLIKIAQENNPEVQASEDIVNINERKYKQAKDDRLPTVNLVLSRTFATSDTIFTVNQNYNVTAAGVQISMPLFEGGGITASIDQAENVLRASREDERATKQKLQQQIYSDWAQLSASIARAEGSLALVNSAKMELSSSLAGVEKRLKTWADVSNSELLLENREVDTISYYSNVIQSQLKLLSTVPVNVDIWEPWIANLSNLSLMNK